MAVADEAMEILSRTPMFSGLPKRSLRNLAAMARVVDHEAGHTIAREGSGAHALHVVAEGEIGVVVGGTEVERRGPGATVGEIALLDGGMRTATISTVSPAKVVAITGTEFISALREDPELAHRLLVHLAGMIRATNSRLAC